MYHINQSYFPGSVGVTLALSLILLQGCVRRVVSVEEVDKMIRDQLPLGSEKQEVKTFINNLHVDQLEIGRDAEFHQATRRALGNRDPEKVAELGDGSPSS